MMRGSATLVVAVIGICLAASGGAAQTTTKLPAAYVAVKGGLAPAGSVNADAEGASLGDGDDNLPIVLEPVNGNSGLNVSFAAEVGYLFSLHPYFALGPAFGLHTWRSDQGSAEGVSIGLDLSLVPQARLPVSETFEVYFSVPLGITLSLLNEYKAWVTGPGVAEDVDPTYGWSFGAYLGLRWAISGSFGLLTELGYQRYAFTHDVEFQVDVNRDKKGNGAIVALALVTQQLRWNVGVFF
jgi:hypothetical protein